jgi:PHD/YefM family antitoxin component YafN of YafNO toxin-antitoxin module
MVRTATATDLKKPLGEVFSDLEATSESLLIRDNGVAVAALLTGSEYELYCELIRSRAWASVEEAREKNAHLSSEEIADEVDRLVERARTEDRASRAAS